MHSHNQHTELDREHHDLTADYYDEAIVLPRQVLCDLIYEHIKKKVLPKMGGNMLDLGAGTGHMALRFGATFEKVVLVDHSQKMLSKAREKIRSAQSGQYQFVVSEASRYIKKTKEQFNFIACTGFLHHLEPDALEEMLKDVGHVLHTGGFLVVAEPVAIGQKEPSCIQWWNKATQPKIEKYLSLAATPDEAPINVMGLKAALDMAGFSVVHERRSWDIFTRFNGGFFDKVAISLMHCLWTGGGIWVGVARKPV